MEYSVWRACERFHLRPPGVDLNWEDCSEWTKAQLLAYDYYRCHEEIELATIYIPKV